MNSIIDDLKNPSSLPEKTDNISVVQTHISIVFVADDFVYKIKKPVDFGFLDFSTLEKRLFYCQQEVKLNRRLSQDIYLEVLPVMFDGDTHSFKKGDGKVVEYAVKMRRIPDDKLMKSLFKRNELSKNHLEKIAEVLAKFHLNAATNAKIAEFGKPERFKFNTDENFEQVEQYIDTIISKKEFNAIKQWTNTFFETNRDLFLKRIKEGKIRDCHGDLHMEHICFTENLSIIDCIEFNDRFRYSDSIADIAFLLMDLEYHKGENHTRILWDAYKKSALEHDVDSLLIFYKVYRAFVRGKVNSFQVDDDAISFEKKEEAIQTAKKYFKLAYSYIV